jgi:hypothetical protein
MEVQFLNQQEQTGLAQPPEQRPLLQTKLTLVVLSDEDVHGALQGREGEGKIKEG